MPRISMIFTVGAIGALTLGLMLTALPAPRLVFNRGSSGWASFAPSTLCLGMAAGFCVAAFAYGVGWLPQDGTASRWHLWLSLLALIVLGIGFAGFSALTTRAGEASQVAYPLGTFLLAAAFSVAAFAVAQLVFFVGLCRALFLGPRL